MVSKWVASVGIPVMVVLGPMLWLAGQGDDSAEVRVPKGRIAFTSDEDNNPGDIYAVDADGTNRIRLTHDPSYDGHASWSPSGDEIAFWSTRDRNAGDIYTMQANGQGVMRLTRHAARDSLPAWSPDGQRIAFVSTRDNNLGDIYVVNIDGTEPMRLTDGPELETQPCWSPDGSQVVFVKVLPGIRSEMCVVPADGGTPQELVAADGWVSDPDWCPVRNELAFIVAKGNSNWGDLWFADALDGNVLRQWRYQGQETGPSWSADGTMICCSHSRRPKAEGANLVIFDTQSNAIIGLTRSAAVDREPDWWGPSP